MKPIRLELSSLIQTILQSLGHEVSVEEVVSSLEVPPEDKFGDLTTNLVLKVAKKAKTNPRALAEKLKSEFEGKLSGSALASRIEKLQVEGPGFVNFHYSAAEIGSVLFRIHEQGENFGKPVLPRRKILLEFVSANPTGPLTVAHGRQAALGDALARILRFCGYAVTTEYYNNDEGVQINTLGESTYARYFGKELAENAYKGDYLIEIAEKLRKSGASLGKDAALDVKLCSNFAKNEIMEGITKDLAEFDVHFDNFYSQEALAKSGKVEQTLEALKKRGVVYESEGAVWLRSTDFGDDKDRVLIKSDKSYTYLTPDIAYHHDKFERGFEKLIDILGPDHHGYIARIKASQQALGHDAGQMFILIAQLVTLYEGDKQVRMSTRAGEFVTLRQILDEVGRDAGRFFFLMRRFDAHLDFDLQLAKSQTNDNPVFYIQYAHARIESIKNLNPDKWKQLPWGKSEALSGLQSKSELLLMRHLALFEDTVLAAERTLEPFRLVPYLMELAGAFHRFYTDNRVVTDDETLTKARFMLCISTQKVIQSGLKLLGVSAPLKM